jgi:hypothetical protein
LIPWSDLLLCEYENYFYNVENFTSAKNTSSDSHDRLYVHKQQSHAFQKEIALTSMQQVCI